ncbi:NUDIX family hydrolase, partial [Dendryphion nanum]
MSTSSFTLPQSLPQCAVKLPYNLTKDQLLAFPAFNDWLSTLQDNLKLQDDKDHVFHKDPYKLREIDVQAVDWFTKTKLGFVKIQAKITTDKGGWLPGAVFLRGQSVAMLMILQPDDVPVGTEQDKHVILTIQPRIAVGSLAMAEIPAGMLDSGEIIGKAINEIKEETGIVVQKKELINMSEEALKRFHAPLWKSSTASDRDTSATKADTNDGEKLKNAMYPSGGACDEAITLLLYEKRVTRAEMDAHHGKLTGLREEGENITLKLVPLENLWFEAGRDGKALAALALYQARRDAKEA